MSAHRTSTSVLHYVRSWLEPSEQFVHGLVSRSRHPGVVVSSGAVTNVDRFPAPSLARLGWIGRVPNESVRRRLRTGLLLGIAARRGVGLVHVHFGYSLPEVAGLVARSGLPLVVSLHGHDVTAWAKLHPAHYAGMIPSVDRWIVPSSWLAAVVAELGVDPNTIAIVPAGVDTHLFSPSPVPSAEVVTFVGRFVEKKGIGVLLESWPLVRAAVPNAELRLCGYGSLTPTAVPPGVSVVDRPTRAQVVAEISRARVVVSPSITAHDGDSETLLIVNLEAQAAGRPVVTTRHGGIPEYVRDGETALLVDERDPRGLAAALVSVLCDDELAGRLGNAGPGFVAKWDVAHCVDQIDQIYEEILGA